MATATVTLDDHSECLALTALVRSDTPDSPGGHTRWLRRRQSLWLSEPPFDRVYRLDSGRLSIIGADDAGRELVLRTIAPGEWFGEYCRCPGQLWPHPAIEARAEEDCQLVEVRHDRWLRALAQNPPAIRAFVTLACVRLARADRRLTMLARRSAEERIGLLLLDRAEAEAWRSSTGLGAVTLTHAEIATEAAMSRPNVSVTLGRFRRKRLIKYRRHESIIVDVRRLRAYLEQFDAPQP